MPIQSTFDKTMLSGAASAEGLTAVAAKAALGGVSPVNLRGLVAYAADAANNGADLAKWRTAFPAILGSLDDATASFLIRVAVTMAGGVVI